MTSSLALLCPGQGTQHAGMFDLVRTDPYAASQLARWSLDDRLGMPLDEALADPALMFSNKLAQPLIVAATLAMWAALRQDMPAPALVAGYSIGELSAYGVAAAVSETDAISLAASRARMMNACLDSTPGQAMAAISGVLIASVRRLLEENGFHIAIHTGEDSAIVGGLLARYSHLDAGVTHLGGRTQLLPVEVASHTPHMQPAVAPFARALRQRPWSPPVVPVLAGISASRIDQAPTAISTLSRQIAEPVRWMDCMDACAEAGITVALELGPGSSLSRMLQARHRAIECRSVADFRTIPGIRQWLGKYLVD